LTIGNGNNQTATAGSVLPIAPSVSVRDARGNPSAGVSVTFTTGANSGVVVGGTAITSASGVATVSSWRLGGTAGTQTLVASVAGLPSVTFSALATSGTATSVVAVSDSLVGSFPVTNFVSPLPSVRVLDANGNPVSGAIVTFVADVGGGTSTLTGSVRTTGADGIATLGTWRLGTVATLYRVRAAVTGLDQLGLEPTFVASGTAAAAAEVVAASTRIQPTVLSSLPVPVVPLVRVLDQYGNGVAGVTVTFTVTSGASGPTASSIAGGVQTLDVLTNGSGYASVTSWTMGPDAGTRTLTATVIRGGILNNPITFEATVPVPAP
jgi:adhesin/invasin